MIHTHCPSVCLSSPCDEVIITTLSAKTWQVLLRSSPTDCASRSYPSISHPELMTRGHNLGRTWHPLNTCLTSYQEYRHSSHYSYIRTGWLVAMALVADTPREPPPRLPGGHSRNSSPSPQNTCRKDEQTLISLPVKDKELVHYSTTRTKSALLFQGGWAVWYSNNWRTGLPFNRHCHTPHKTEEACQTIEPNNVQSLQQLKANLIHTKQHCRMTNK